MQNLTLNYSNQQTLIKKNKQNGSNSTNHSPQTWHFELTEIYFCLLRGIASTKNDWQQQNKITDWAEFAKLLKVVP